MLALALGQVQLRVLLVQSKPKCRKMAMLLLLVVRQVLRVRIHWVLQATMLQQVLLQAATTVSQHFQLTMKPQIRNHGTDSQHQPIKSPLRLLHVCAT